MEDKERLAYMDMLKLALDPELMKDPEYKKCARTIGHVLVDVVMNGFEE